MAKISQKISVEQFFELFLQELRENPNMTAYYKFLNNATSFNFRKAYFIQRLSYIWEQVSADSYDDEILDVGCGYGTTAIFLTLNGLRVSGLTLEFYYEQIAGRLKYWQQFGDLSKLNIIYENLFDFKPSKKYRSIIVQDTLHHLEPISDAISTLRDLLTPAGKIIAIEENGANIFERARLYKYRGSKRIIESYDEKLGKTILIGNENTRSIALWRQIFNSRGMAVDNGDIKFIRFLWPSLFRSRSIAEVIQFEQKVAMKYPVIRNYFFFGLNFTVRNKPAG